MSAITQLVLKDRKTVPVDHTFDPAGVDANGVARLVEYTGVPIGQATFTFVLKEGKNAYTGEIRLRTPVVQTQTINGISSPLVVHVNQSKHQFIFAKGSNEQERADHVGMLASALPAAQTMINDMLVKLMAPYSA